MLNYSVHMQCRATDLNGAKSQESISEPEKKSQLSDIKS